jgi:hypothetical protein
MSNVAGSASARKSLWVVLASVFLYATAIAGAYLTLVLSSGQDLGAYLEPSQYTPAALGLLETGRLVVDVGGEFVPEVERLPVYPGFLAGAFLMFGTLNFVAVAVIQCVVFGLLAVSVALTVRAIEPAWFMAAGLLAGSWPALFIRASAIMPDLLMASLVAFGMCACIWAARSKWIVLLLLFAGVCFGAAHMTRPAMLGVVFFAWPALAFLLKEVARLRLGKAVILALIPFLVMWAFSAPRLLETHKIYGVAALTSQPGAVIAEWSYPCLVNRWGCGERNPEATKRALSTIASRLEGLEPEERHNPMIVDQLRMEVGLELIQELPVQRVVTALIGGYAKVLLHTSLVEVLSRFELERPSFRSLIGAGGEDGGVKVRPTWLAIWIVFQASLVLTRCVQLFVVVRGVQDGRMRGDIIFLVALAAPLVAVSLGLGNPRHRVPIEPMLVVLTVMGLAYMWRRFRPPPADRKE